MSFSRQPFSPLNAKAAPSLRPSWLLHPTALAFGFSFFADSSKSRARCDILSEAQTPRRAQNKGLAGNKLAGQVEGPVMDTRYEWLCILMKYVYYIIYIDILLIFSNLLI